MGDVKLLIFQYYDTNTKLSISLFLYQLFAFFHAVVIAFSTLAIAKFEITIPIYIYIYTKPYKKEAMNQWKKKIQKIRQRDK